MVDESKTLASGTRVKSIAMPDVDDFKRSTHCTCDEINGSEPHNERSVVRRFVPDVVDNESMAVPNGSHETQKD